MTNKEKYLSSLFLIGLSMEKKARYTPDPNSFYGDYKPWSPNQGLNPVKTGLSGILPVIGPTAYSLADKPEMALYAGLTSGAGALTGRFGLPHLIRRVMEELGKDPKTIDRVLKNKYAKRFGWLGGSMLGAGIGAHTTNI